MAFYITLFISKHSGFLCAFQAVFILCALFSSAPAAFASGLSVQLVVIPNVREIPFEQKPQQLTLIARVNRQVDEFAWSLQGPGQLTGDSNSREIAYVPPSSIEQESTEVSVTVRVTDNRNTTAQDSVTFLFLAPPQQPVAVSTPEVQPEQAAQLDRLLQRADNYFVQTFFIEPEDGNAFDLYKEVLRIDPANRHAHDKILEMLALYKKWGNNAYNKNAYEDSRRFYKRYLFIADYVLYTLDEQSISFDVLEAQKRLLELQAHPISTPAVLETPAPTATPEVLPTATPTCTPTPLPLYVEILAEADTYFAQKNFMTPISGNAFDLYQKVLRIQPFNRHARQKIYDMAQIYKDWGHSNYQQQRYEKAAVYYQRYLSAAHYIIAQDFGEATIQDIQETIQDVQTRLEWIESSLTPTPTPTPSPIPTPKLIIRSSEELKRQLQEIKLNLAQALKQYGDLKAREQQGRNVQPQIIPVIREIVKILQEIERIYEAVVENDFNIAEIVERTQKTRENFEDELQNRLQTLN